MNEPTDTEAFGDMESWAMRRFAARTFAVLQGADGKVAGDGQLTDVEITDDQGRTAVASFRVIGGQVTFMVHATPAPGVSPASAPRAS